jgi:Ca2+-binding EF-hand superfamily protein
MKVIRTIFCVCLALAFVSGCASSSGGGSPGKDEKVFEKYDRDSDGKISKEEYGASDLTKESKSSSFESLDKDGDGFLDRDEFGGGFRGGRR